MIQRKDPDAVNKLINNTFIAQLVWANQVLNIMESFLNLFLISIFLGSFWFIMCTLQETYLIEFNGEGEPDFIVFYYEKNKDRMLIVITYFMTTTLATVGFGDFKPISNFERILGSLVMLGGVAVFSLIFSRATASLNKIMLMVDPHKEQLAQLDLFFGVLRRFNGNQQIDKNIRAEIEQFLEYSWNHDPTQALKSDADVKLLSELPQSVRLKIYTDFLFDEFLKQFKFIFTIPKMKPLQIRRMSHQPRMRSIQRIDVNSTAPMEMYTWNDDSYSDFMISLLNIMEQRLLPADQLVFEEETEN